MRVLITGANGQLGQDLKRIFSSKKTVSLTHKELDVTSIYSVKQRFNLYKPDIVINTASYHNVEKCEQNITSAFSVNVFGVHNLVELCQNLNIILVHFSTDYVFNGQKRTPYREEDKPQPINIYGVSKLAGEYVIRYNLKKYYIIRTSGLYGIRGSQQKGGNFVETMLQKAQSGIEIKVVGDVIFSPTYTYDLACAIKKLIMTEKYGVYHITNSGFCSWYEFAKEIFKISKTKVSLQKIDYKDLNTKVLRPRNSVLDNSKLIKMGIPELRPWQLALKDYFKEREGRL